MATDIPAIAGATRAAPAAPAQAAVAVAGSVGGNITNAVAPVAQATGAADVLAKAAQQVVAALPGHNEFSFNFDKQTGMTIVRVYNADTGELVRQIPTEEVVRIAQIMRQEQAQPGVMDVLA